MRKNTAVVMAAPITIIVTMAASSLIALAESLISPFLMCSLVTNGCNYALVQGDYCVLVRCEKQIPSIGNLKNRAEKMKITEETVHEFQLDSLCPISRQEPTLVATVSDMQIENSHLCMRSHMHSMGSKNVSITDEAYDALSRERKKGVFKEELPAGWRKRERLKAILSPRVQSITERKQFLSRHLL